MGRKLIIAPEGRCLDAKAGAVTRPWSGCWRRRTAGGAGSRAATRSRSLTSQSRKSDRCVRLPALATHLPGAGHCGGDPRRTTAEGAETGRDAGERPLVWDEQRSLLPAALSSRALTATRALKRSPVSVSASLGYATSRDGCRIPAHATLRLCVGAAQCGSSLKAAGATDVLHVWRTSHRNGGGTATDR